MQRNIAALTEKEFDLVIVGGGIFGACAAWDAASRGLTVALLERGDFCQATSANHFKIVHGGIRYLQHGDVYRIRESNRERNALLKIAPHLVQPLPILIPTYGHGFQGKEILAAGMRLYDLLVCDRNRGLKDPARQIPSARFVSREECLGMYPEIEQKNLTGAAIFFDGQIYNPPRLVLSFIRSAVETGAVAGNYMEVVRFRQSGNCVYGVEVKDTLGGNEFLVRGKIVLNATGPWAQGLLKSTSNIPFDRMFTFSRDAYFVVRRQLTTGCALSVQGRTRDPDAIFNRGHRHLFLVPWRRYTLIGVWHVVYNGDPDQFILTEEELLAFLEEVNGACPWANLSLQDVSQQNAGLVLFGENRPGATDLKFGKRSQLIDHEKENGVSGLLTLIGVRATTARGVAEKAVDLVVQKLCTKAPKSNTASAPIYGGRIERFEMFLNDIMEARPSGVSPAVMRALARNYGSEYQEVLKYLKQNPTFANTLGHFDVLKAEVVHAVRDEMGQKLGDVVFRRTDLGTGEYPGDNVLLECAWVMAKELGWDQERVQNEIQEVKENFPRHISQKAHEPSANKYEYSGVY